MFWPGDKMADYEDLEEIFRLRRHEPTPEELEELEEIKKKTTKNKFVFLQNGKVNLTENEVKVMKDMSK
jgi:hypothetical protein